MWNSSGYTKTFRAPRVSHLLGESILVYIHDDYDLWSEAKHCLDEVWSDGAGVTNYAAFIAFYLLGDFFFLAI